MAGRAKAKGGAADFFAAVESLTWREMRDVAGLIALQLEGGKEPILEGDIAQALSDAADSFAEED